MFKKSKAFTLAEILITIGILGVVSALLLPSINTNVAKTQYVNALRSISTNLTDKIQAQMALEDVDDVGDLKAFQNNTEYTGFLRDLSQIIPMRPATKDHTNLKALNGKPKSTVNHYQFAEKLLKERIYLMKNGGLIYIGTYIPGGRRANASLEQIQAYGGQLYRYYADFYIDINGHREPNIFGRDIFRFWLGQDGVLYPLGGKDISIFWGHTDSTWKFSSHNLDWNCHNTTSYGIGCPGRIREENWKMNY